jgi:hypothetical protein
MPQDVQRLTRPTASADSQALCLRVGDGAVLRHCLMICYCLKEEIHLCLDEMVLP